MTSPVSLPEGQEWIVEAQGCDPLRLASAATMQQVFERIISDLTLHPVGAPLWHTFPEPGGVTGLVMLAESHLTVHTFPEYGSACFNLFCCTPRAAWPWRETLAELLGAESVQVRHVIRAYAGASVGQGASA